MTITELVEKCFDQAVRSGWTDKPISIPEQIALIHSEASEALEEYRNDTPFLYFKDGKPEGIAAEYADIVIRVCHYAHDLGIDLEKTILQKLAFNASRGHRHGGKKI